MRTVPPETYFPSDLGRARKPAPEGVYFFYGSLLDPNMLVEILGLDTTPELRPAYLKGYRCKLWGQYPALLPSPEGERVEGAAYRVRRQGDAEKLATYETRSYLTSPCEIKYIDGQSPGREEGVVFVFVGNERELIDGSFDLRGWLRRVGRLEALHQLDARKQKGAVGVGVEGASC